MPLKAALSAFLAEFDRFEAQGVRIALRSLSGDADFAERSERLLDLAARITLLERIANARAPATDLSARFTELLARARWLLDLHADIVRVPPNLAVGDPDSPPLIVRRRPWSPQTGPGEPTAFWIPGVQQLQAFAGEAARLNASLCAIAAEFTRP